MTCSIIGCDNPREGTTLFCANHNYEHRKEIRETKKIRVVRPPRKVSEKYADELVKYSKLKKEFLEFKMICEFERCNHKSEQIHHCSKNRKNFFNTNTWLAVCVEHHNFIERVMSAEERRLKSYLTD